jgi:hypothetical protein
MPMTSPSNRKTYLVTSRKKALAEISGHIGTGKKLLETNVTTMHELQDLKNRYRKWREYGALILTNNFSDDTYAAELKSQAGVVYSGPELDVRYEYFRRDFSRDITTLESIEEMLPKIPTKPRAAQPRSDTPATAPTVNQHFYAPVSNAIGSNRGRASQSSSTLMPAGDSKRWQIFIALLAIVPIVVGAYIAYRLHWV